MASSVLTPTQQHPVSPQVATMAGPPPRKRRRRTAGGGASDDCFACTSRGVQCDRKRPYCTQCIDIGKECSGYKTTLTWGVGVASRGKLRGLSCPIANKNVDGSDASPAEIEARRRKSSVSRLKKEEGDNAHNTSSSATLPTPSTFSRPLKPTQAASPYPPMLPPSSNGWQLSGFGDHMQSRQAGTLRHQSLQHLQTSRELPYEGMGALSSGRSTSSYSGTEFHTPIEYSGPSTSRAYSDPMPPPRSAPIVGHSATAGNMANFGIDISGLDVYTGPKSSGPYSTASDTAVSSTQLVDTAHPVFPPVSFSPLPTETEQDDKEAADDYRQLSLVNARFGSPFFQVNSRMQTLMDYYDRNVCPYLVAFDSSDNPYRKHVLRLAIDNDGLQNAIAALSTNNLRMRRKNLKRTGFVKEMSDQSENPYGEDLNEPTPEESCYKQMSIDHLNMQLLDTRAAQDDSVLATLVILCLFHVCDSGFSKFKTQLAGVQKLLSLRHPDTQSDFTRWVEMFFTWFDVMTSTVNDRETQLGRSSSSTLEFSANLGTTEQFAGCDGQLFKIISRLGRLNLLAQGRQVRSENGSHGAKRSAPQAARMRFAKKVMGRKLTNPLSMSPADYENIDGNGWGTPIISSDEDADGSADEHNTYSDNRHTFWVEWQDIRSKLFAWQMDTQQLMTPISPNGAFDTTNLTASQRDLVHINESFRFAAILYTERLGQPLLASSDNQFQQLVSEGLYHISALPVTSCVNKFLLWPLFIIGTECVDESHRNIIRNRCRDLTEESGFFNNISSLDVLERVWKEVGSNVYGSEEEEVKARRRDSEASTSGRYGQAFRWRKAMDRMDGEYIVI